MFVLNIIKGLVNRRSYLWTQRRGNQVNIQGRFLGGNFTFDLQKMIKKEIQNVHKSKGKYQYLMVWRTSIPSGTGICLYTVGRTNRGPHPTQTGVTTPGTETLACQ